MATIVLKPNGDAAPNQWTMFGGSGGLHYTCLTQAGEPDNGTTYLTESTLNEVEEFDMETVAVSSATQVVVRVRAFGTNSKGGLPSLGVNVYFDATWKTEQVVEAAEAWTDYDFTFTGTFDQTDVDNLQVRLRRTSASAPTGGGALDVTQMYATLTYTAPAAPSGWIQVIVPQDM